MGQSVYGGSRNLEAPLVIEVTGVGGESAIGKVLAALESAQLSILPRHFEVWLSGYLPLVLTVAATVLFVTGELQRAIAVMVVAVPTGVGAGSFGLSGGWILQKGGTAGCIDQAC